MAHIVEQQLGSGLGARAFCEKSGIAYQSFMKWRRRLDLTENRITNKAPSFVELTAEPIKMTADESSRSVVHTDEPLLIELSLGRGVELRITSRL